MTSAEGPRIGQPVEPYTDYRYVPWAEGIYPQFKGGTSPSEMGFFADLVERIGAKSILDLGVGGGTELAGIVQELESRGTPIKRVEGNEVDPAFIDQARERFQRLSIQATIHKANWMDLPVAEPPYEGPVDFAFLSGNSLTYVGGSTPAHAFSNQRSIVQKLSQLIAPAGHLFIDMRNYDYIGSMRGRTLDDIQRLFTFDRTVYYHGTGAIKVVPVYISDQLVALHYYDVERKVWGELDLHPISQASMTRMLEPNFDIVDVYHDFEKVGLEESLRHPERPSQFVQFLARKKN